MATDSMRQLIEETIADPGLNDALIDISEFKLGMLNRFTFDDILILEDSGFEFVSRSITQRKQELRTFITSHPALESGDFETMMDKIMFYLSKTSKERLREKQRRQKRTRALMEKYFKDEDDYEQDVPDDAKSHQSKSAKKNSKRPKRSKADKTDHDSLDSLSSENNEK